MAKKPASNDFQAHEETYHAFLSVTKTSIIAMIFTILALFSFIEAHQPWLGLVLLLVAVPCALLINRATSSKS